MKNVNYTGFRVDLDQEAKKCIAFFGTPCKLEIIQQVLPTQTCNTG